MVLGEVLYLINYQRNENELLETFLDGIVFNERRNYTSPKFDLSTAQAGRFPNVSEGVGIELIVRPECNQHCDYCYIAQFGHELYPMKYRVNNETILSNLRSLLDYVYNKRKIFIPRWELFAGDLFYDDLYYDVLDVFYDIIKPLYQTYHHLFTNGNGISILTPSNCSFIADDAKVAKFDEYFNRMESIGCHLILSYSTDGKYATDIREHHDVSDEFYDKAFAFLKKYGYGPHPMISAESIDNYIQNYDWWMENMPKYSDSNTMPMMLEVRNNNWTPEKIDKYEELLHHVVKSQLEFFGSKEALAKNLFDTSDRMKMGYNMIRILPYSDADHAARYTCSMQWLLHITLNDLSIVPCHRTSYEQFHIGKFTLDDNGNINGVEAKNVAIGIMTHGFRASTIPKCSGCKYASMCMFGCLGSQYENSGELFSPIDCVCDLMKRKIVVLSKEFRDLGLLDIALEKQYITQATYDLYMDMCNEKPKEVPWITVIRNNKPLNK